MASKQSNVDFVLEQMAQAGPVSARQMFGEYAIYAGDKIVALFCDDELFLKPTNAGRAFISESSKVKEAPPYPGAKPWLAIGGDLCEDADWLSELVRATAKELPAPKPKVRRKAEKPAKTKAKISHASSGPKRTIVASKKTKEKTVKKKTSKAR